MQRCFILAATGALALLASWGSPAAARQGSCGLAYTAFSSQQPSVSILSGVSGSWAVGYSAQPAALIDELVNGVWTPVSNPAPPNSTSAGLSAVAVSAANDVWAVGAYNGNQTLIEHWNGSMWSIVAGAPGVSTPLSAVAANPRNPSDVWAVGGLSVEHWNGSIWSVVNHVPHGGANSFQFTGVSVTPTGHVWVIGDTIRGLTATPWIDYFNGKRWATVQGAVTVGGLASVSAPHDGSVWVSGGSIDYRDPTGPFVEHWDGSTWSLVPLPTASGVSGQIASVSAGDDNVYATGSYNALDSTDIIVPIILVQRLRLPWIDVPMNSYVLKQIPKTVAALPGHAFEFVGVGFDPTSGETESSFAISGGCIE